MPLSRYFGGDGAEVMADFVRRYGVKEGKRRFYATVNANRKGTKAQRAVQPKGAPGSRRTGADVLKAAAGQRKRSKRK